MDTNIDQDYLIRLKEEIEAIKGVDQVDSINTKPIGVSFIVIVKVSVSGTMTVEQGHSIAAQIKEKIKNKKNIGDVVVHVNPA